MHSVKNEGKNRQILDYFFGKGGDFGVKLKNKYT